MISKGLDPPHNLSLPNYTKGMGILVLDADRILMAGGPSCASFIFTISNSKISPMQNFKTPVSYFAFSFINGKPAVIGGLQADSSKSNKVKVLNNNIWVNVLPLNIARSHAQAIYHAGKTFVFGGVSQGWTNSIEVYETSWKVLGVSLPVLKEFGLCGNGSSIYLFGGIKNGENATNTVYQFNCESNNFIKVKNLGSTFTSSNVGTVCVVDNIFYLLDSHRKLIQTYFP
jgi:hypothetical protein